MWLFSDDFGGRNFFILLFGHGGALVPFRSDGRFSLCFRFFGGEGGCVVDASLLCGKKSFLSGQHSFGVSELVYLYVTLNNEALVPA